MKVFLLLVVLAALAGCSTAEKARRMEEYRRKTNETLRKVDVVSDVTALAIRDADYAAVAKSNSEARLSGARVRSPKLLRSVEPKYPFSKRVEWREAVLHFAVIVDAHGRIRYAQYVPHPEIQVDAAFVVAAEDALRQWLFEPGMVNGSPTEFAVIAPVAFQLR